MCVFPQSVFVQGRLFVSTSGVAFACMHVRICMCICVSVYIHVLYACMCVYGYVYVHVCVCVCVEKCVFYLCVCALWFQGCICLCPFLTCCLCHSLTQTGRLTLGMDRLDAFGRVGVTAPFRVDQIPAAIAELEAKKAEFSVWTPPSNEELAEKVEQIVKERQEEIARRRAAYRENGGGDRGGFRGGVHLLVFWESLPHGG